MAGRTEVAGKERDCCRPFAELTVRGRLPHGLAIYTLQYVRGDAKLQFLRRDRATLSCLSGLSAEVVLLRLLNKYGGSRRFLMWS